MWRVAKKTSKFGQIHVISNPPFKRPLIPRSRSVHFGWGFTCKGASIPEMGPSFSQCWVFTKWYVTTASVLWALDGSFSIGLGRRIPLSMVCSMTHFFWGPAVHAAVVLNTRSRSEADSLIATMPDSETPRTTHALQQPTLS